MKHSTLLSAILMTFGLAISTGANANLIGGVEFPQGAISFADEVVSFNVGSGSTVPHQGAFNALGTPNYPGDNAACLSQATCSYVSLGSGGTIILKFIDNLLTGSNSNALDLWVFEVGSDIEDTFVALSADGISWTEVGKVFGATAGIDIDAFGFTSAAQLAYVRLIDDPNEGETSGPFIGADIDAVGAISTIHTPPISEVPLPAAAWLFGSSILGLFGLRRNSIV